MYAAQAVFSRSVWTLATSVHDVTVDSEHVDVETQTKRNILHEGFIIMTASFIVACRSDV